MSTTFWQRLRHGQCIANQRADWLQFAGSAWTETIMAAAMTDDFHAKQGRATGRLILKNETGELPVYVKRHYRLPWWRGLLATLMPRGCWSPGFQERRHLEWALAQGFRVPAPVAAAQYVGPCGRLRSVLAIEELTGMLALHQAIPLAQRSLSPTAFAAWKRLLVRELARVAAELHRRRHYHKDLYLCHFYLPRTLTERWSPTTDRSFRDRLYMIDLHRLGHHPWTWPIRQWKDLAQLAYSSEVAGVTARDRIRFWRLYRGGGRRSRLLRGLELCIRLKWQRYRDHNAKHPHLPGEGQEQKKVAA